MPSARAAPEIDPDAWIASSSAILPGPMRSPLVRSRRMLRRVSGMGPRRRKRVEPEHREPAAFVKRRARAIPPIPGKRDRVSIATEVLRRGAGGVFPHHARQQRRRLEIGHPNSLPARTCGGSIYSMVYNESCKVNLV